MGRGSRIAVVAAGTIVFAFVGGSSGVTARTGDDAGSAASTGDLARAVEIAREVTGGGRVTGMELGGEESFYEVEVTLPDGRRVDLQLDEDFGVVGSLPEVEEIPGD
jgi:hypothetical protein